MTTAKYIAYKTKARMNESLALISGESLDHVPLHEVMSEIDAENGNAYALYNALCTLRTQDSGHVRCNVGFGVLEMDWMLNATGRFRVQAHLV